jgi:membrane protein DedA with SNARE-associated domain
VVSTGEAGRPAKNADAGLSEGAERTNPPEQSVEVGQIGDISEVNSPEFAEQDSAEVAELGEESPTSASETSSSVDAAGEDATLPTDTEEELPWWDDPALPWAHKPTRADLACWAWIAVVGIYGIVMLPLRAVLLGLNPPIAAMITGGRSMVVATGAWVRVNGGPLVVYWLVASVSLVKFSWVYWWAGKLWGTGIINLWAGKSDRSKRRAEKAVRLTNRFWVLAVVLTFLPIPFPMPIVYAAIGAAGTSLKKFLPPVFLTSLVFQAGYLALGWWIGEPAVKLMNLYAQYMWYAVLIIFAGMIATWWWRSHKEKIAAAEVPSAITSTQTEEK